MIVQMGWEPDTCGCRVVHSVDTDTSQRALVNYIFTCSFHRPISGDSPRYTVMGDDNIRKNSVEGVGLENFKSLLTGTDPETGAIVYKSGIAFNWFYSGISSSRVLTVSYSGVAISIANRDTLQTSYNTRFGSGRVIIQ